LSRDSVLIEAEDHAYGSATKIVSNRSRVGESVGTGDGSKTHFYLDYAHVVPDSEEIYVDGALQTSGYSMNYDTGQIIFDSPPASGAVIEANYSYYDAYPGDGSYNAVKYEGSGEALIVYPQVICPGKGRYRIFVKAKCVGGTGQQFRIKLDGGLQEGSWISCGAADTYWQAWDAGTFWVDDCVELRLYAKGASSSQPLVVDYLLLVRLPDNDEPDEVFSFESGKAAEAVISCEANGTDLALEFDGVDDCVEVPDSESLKLTNFTIAVWIKGWANNKFSRIVGKPTDGSGGGFDLATNKLYTDLLFRYSKAGVGWSGGPTASGALEEGVWQFFAVRVWNNGTNTLAEIVNGSGNVLGAHTWEEAIVFNTTRALRIGSDPRNYNPFNGSIGQVYIFNKTLSGEEIQTLYGGSHLAYREVALNTSRLNLCGTYLLPNEDCYLWCYMNVTYPEEPWYFDLLAEVT